MKIGIFSNTFTHSTLDETLDVIASHGMSSIQYDLPTDGDEPLPVNIDEVFCSKVKLLLESRQIEMATLSGTYNMIHPDENQRKIGMVGLESVIRACPLLGTDIVTLCTGTRSRESMWRRHPQNASKEAWDDLLKSMQQAVITAEKYGVVLAFEPEVNNVVDTAVKARRLIDEIASPNLKVCIDGANLFHTGQLPRMHEILDEAFDLLGDDIITAHAKDLSSDGDAGHEAAGTGLLDYEHYTGLLKKIGFTGSLILHSLTEDQVAGSLACVRRAAGL